MWGIGRAGTGHRGGDEMGDFFLPQLNTRFCRDDWARWDIIRKHSIDIQRDDNLLTINQ